MIKKGDQISKESTEVETMIISSKVINNSSKDHEEDDDVPLPGFRFHPTDEELVGFYLRRKVEKKPISIELIKQIDIYKHDPWDLPKASNVGDKEWYFFCKRGRKYRNSIRPNRVTGSGFWKATGIDRPIYSAGGEGRDCIGLKKSLVYYRGSAGKGTKTDWMMHEFRLPAEQDHHLHNNIKTTSNHINIQANKTSINASQEAEVWTLCRIFKRNVSYRKCMPDWKELSGGKRMNHSSTNAVLQDASSKTCSMELESSDHKIRQSYISFTNTSNNIINAPVAPLITRPQINDVKKSPPGNCLMINSNNSNYYNNNIHGLAGQVDIIANQMVMSSFSQAPASSSTYNSTASHASSDVTDFLIKHADWDELRSIVEFGAAPMFY